jgi:hypothetical protein
MSKKLSKEERLWNFLTAKTGSAQAKRIYHYVIKNFGPKPGKEIIIKYSVDTTDLKRAIAMAAKLKKIPGIKMRRG